jgi:hypothetical protein
LFLRSVSSFFARTPHLLYHNPQQFSMILVGQKMAIGYNAMVDKVFGTRGFNPLPHLNKRARG